MSSPRYLPKRDHDKRAWHVYDRATGRYHGEYAESDGADEAADELNEQGIADELRGLATDLKWCGGNKEAVERIALRLDELADDAE